MNAFTVIVNRADRVCVMSAYSGVVWWKIHSRTTQHALSSDEL